MKKTFVYSLLTILALTGCQTKELDSLNDEPEVILNEDSKVFTAIIDDDFNPETRTTLDGEGNVLWKMGDQVSIFAGSTVNEQYQVTDASDGKTAASLNKVGGGGFVAGTEIDNNVAFYPYASTAEIAKSGVNYVISGVELPATQTYAAGSFGNGAFPMVAVTGSTEDMNLKFKNILGGLKLQLKGTATIASITITGNNNEKLYGDADVTVTYGGTPSISLTEADAKTVTLDCGAGVTLDAETATPFIIALPPMTMTGGFTVVVTDTEGKEMEISTSKLQTITRSNLLRMPAVNYEVPDINLSKPITFTSSGSTNVSVQKNGTPDDITLEYRIGDNEWASYTIGSGIALTDGESIQFRAGAGGNDRLGTDKDSDFYAFSTNGTGTVEVSGNIMSLLDQSLQRTTLSEYCFARLFQGAAKLTTAANLKLPATTLATGCYARMFQQCSKLTTAPELPATTLAAGCYRFMFQQCSQLTTAPKLPATTLATSCYQSMFVSCSSLATAPELPATNLAEYCYNNMFEYCSGLTTAPELPATTLANNCYLEMFEYCTGLTTAPELPATTLTEHCYHAMFSKCTGLTTAPELPATTLTTSCYQSMFYGCSSLNYIKMLATDISASNCLNFWVQGVAATGTFVKNSSATWAVSGRNGVPDGWTIITE